MNRDPLGERSAQLFAAGREETPPDETRLRIAAILRSHPVDTIMPRPARRWSTHPRITLAAAAAVFAGWGFFFMPSVDKQPMNISAESYEASTSEPRDSDAPPVEEAPVNEPAPKAASAHPAPSLVPRPPRKRARASLEEELASMQRARAALARGDASTSLLELDRFGRDPGWRELTIEASLLRIEALAQTGRADEARTQARQFVEKHPNDPLVVRAEKLAAPSKRAAESQKK